jgi:FkbM family methyltransferase
MLKALLRRTPLWAVARRVRDRIFPVRGLGLNAVYDAQTIEVMRKVLRPGAVAVDAGAHTGQITREMVALTPGGRVLAFEPIPALAREIRETVPGAEVFEYALSDEAGPATFQHVVNDPAYSGLRQRDYDRPDPIIEEIPVTVARLDDLLPADVAVDFIKLDVEGAEFAIVRGALEVIRRGRPVIVFEASARSTGRYGVTPDEMFRTFTETLGYRVSTMDRWLRGRGPYTLAEFAGNWNFGPEYYFIAYPG